MSAMTTCCCCAREVILDACGQCGSLRSNAHYFQRGVRMASGTEHAIAFSSRCMGRITAADWPRILRNNLAVFEEAWAKKDVPEDQRALHREEMQAWRIVGWANEISAEAALAMARTP